MLDTIKSVKFILILTGPIPCSIFNEAIRYGSDVSKPKFGTPTNPRDNIKIFKKDRNSWDVCGLYSRYTGSRYVYIVNLTFYQLRNCTLKCIFDAFVKSRITFLALYKTFCCDNKITVMWIRTRIDELIANINNVKRNDKWISKYVIYYVRDWY